MLTRCELDRVTIEMRRINSFTHEPLRVVTHTAWCRSNVVGLFTRHHDTICREVMMYASRAR